MASFVAKYYTTGLYEIVPKYWYWQNQLLAHDDHANHKFNYNYIYISKTNSYGDALQPITQVANKQVSTYTIVETNSQVITFFARAVVHIPNSQHLVASPQRWMVIWLSSEFFESYPAAVEQFPLWNIVSYHTKDT